MTVYVDNMFLPARVGRINDEWCHMFSDDPDPTELHEFAKQIGMKRSWFQHKSDTPAHDHYDVTTRVRTLAVKHGAVEVDMRRAVEIWDDKRQYYHHNR